MTRRTFFWTREVVKAKQISRKTLSSPVGVPKRALYLRLILSVMLRVLEYFKGILIMTTNRVMTFDVAMLSRCHYAVAFKFLTVAQEKAIWMGYVAQLTDQNSSQKHEIQAWVNQITKKGTKLSGRDIRNVFTTAQTLAQATPSKKLRKYHLERVYDQLMDFSEAMKDFRNNQQLQLNAPYS